MAYQEYPTHPFQPQPEDPAPAQVPAHANRAAMRAQRIREFLAANPGRRGAPMGRAPTAEGSLRSDDDMRPAMIAGGEGMPKPIASGEGMVKPPVISDGVVKPDPMLIPKPGMLQKPAPRTNGPLDKARLLNAIGPRRLGGP